MTNPDLFKAMTINGFDASEKFPKSKMIYGAIGLDYKFILVIVESSIDSNQYMSNIMNSCMIDELDSNWGKGMWIFQQDGSRCHNSRKIVKWLSSKCRHIKRWHAYSPDLNPNENFEVPQKRPFLN